MFGACGLVAAARQAGALRLLLLYPVPEAKTFNMLLDGFADLAKSPPRYRSAKTRPSTSCASASHVRTWCTTQ